MNRLVAALSKWKGRMFCEALLQERGLAVHRAFQDFLMATYGPDRADEIERYWDEVAQETVAAAGRCNSGKRIFSGDHGYRSSYLDDLARGFDYTTCSWASPVIDPSVLQFIMEFRSPTELAGRIARTMEIRKEEEAVRLQLPAFSWSGRKTDVLAPFRQFMESLGFASNKRICSKRINDNLMIDCYADTGGRPTLLGLKLEARIYHPDNPEEYYWLDCADDLIPGFLYYQLWQSPASAILGIFAHAHFFDAISRSF